MNYNTNICMLWIYFYLYVFTNKRVNLIKPLYTKLSFLSLIIFLLNPIFLFVIIIILTFLMIRIKIIYGSILIDLVGRDHFIHKVLLLIIIVAVEVTDQKLMSMSFLLLWMGVEVEWNSEVTVQVERALWWVFDEFDDLGHGIFLLSLVVLLLLMLFTFQKDHNIVTFA